MYWFHFSLEKIIGKDGKYGCMACMVNGKSNMEILMASYNTHFYWHRDSALIGEQVICVHNGQSIDW